MEHVKVALVTGGSPYLNAIKNTQLAAFVEAQIIKPPAEILSAFEELVLVRETAARVVTLYAKARDAEISDPTNQKKSLLADQAAFLMRESLKEVVSMCEQVARISATVNRAFSWGYVNHIVLIMLRAISEEIKDDDLMRRINNRYTKGFKKRYSDISKSR